ncbi:hypothetical protein L596_018481 [Steinernema carpocapsae]|uniref:Uncharacterized protein n=1 Tax=Steinernema carpocapsae TaxID=34508 RepID=A0A4U5N4R3_STECR|nr:hypothetical protein L596_018481 [Steinernema carpocapsae]
MEPRGKKTPPGETQKQNWRTRPSRTQRATSNANQNKKRATRRPQFEDRAVCRLSDYAGKGQFLMRYSDYEDYDDRIWSVEDHILIRSWIRAPHLDSGEAHKRCYVMTDRYMGWWPNQPSHYFLFPIEHSRILKFNEVEIYFPTNEEIETARHNSARATRKDAEEDGNY